MAGAEHGYYSEARYYYTFTDQEYELHTLILSPGFVEEVKQSYGIDDMPFGVMVGNGEVWITYDEPKQRYAMYFLLGYRGRTH